MSFGLVCIAGTLVLSLALGTFAQIAQGGMSGVASILADHSDSGPMDEFAFTDEEQGRFNWIVAATDLPWIGAFRFLPTTNAASTVLLSVSDTSGVALAQCSFPRGATDENEWTEFVWSLQADSLHCNVSTSASRFRFPLRAIPRKRYVVRVSAIEGPRCIAGLMVRNQKPTGCPPRFQRVVFVSQGFNCGCPLRPTPDPSVGTTPPQLRPDLQQEPPKHTAVAFPRFEPATIGLFDPTTTAPPFVDDLTSPQRLSHLSTGPLAEVAAAVTEVAAAIRESSPEWPAANSHVNATTAFPFPVWNNSSRAISSVNNSNSNSNPVRTTVGVARASTTPLPPTTPKATTSTKTTPASTTRVISSRRTTTSSPPPMTPRTPPSRGRGQSPSADRNTTASPKLTSSSVDLAEVTSGAASTPGQTSTTLTTARLAGSVASTPNITVTCSETSCQNNGTCVVRSATELVCICAFGFNGTYCESAVPCASNPCQNGGLCEPVDDDTFRCDCPPNTSGAFCESYLCENECHNGGVCIVDENQFTKCNCTPGFVGYNCNLLDVCSGVVTPCDEFGPTATCQVVDEHASPFLVNATHQCLCPDANNGQVECASLLNTTPVTADMSSAITTGASSSTSLSLTSTTSTMTPPSATSSTTSPSTTSMMTSSSSTTLTTQLWTTTTSILAESSSPTAANGVNAVEGRAPSGAGATMTIILVVVGVLLLLVLLFMAALLSVRFVRRSRKLHGKYNPAKEESMVGAGLSLPMATINKEERLI